MNRAGCENIHRHSGSSVSSAAKQAGGSKLMGTRSIRRKQRLNMGKRHFLSALEIKTIIYQSLRPKAWNS